MRNEVEFSKIVLSNEGHYMHGYLTSTDKWRMYTAVDEITPHLKTAIIFKEDQYFYYHFGVNPIAIVRAIWNNFKKGRRTSGASTITMQVVRLLDPKPRTYANKIIEMLQAIQLEWHLTKDQILQMYLNLVPYGGNIEGVKSASMIYFEKMPNHLSLAEVTTLAVVPNRPNSLYLGRKNDSIVKVRNEWLDRFDKAGLFTKSSIEDAKNEILDVERTPLPRLSPHLSYRLSKNANNWIINSTIDMAIQTRTANLVKGYIDKVYYRNIKNAAVIIIENESRAVRGYIGSANYHNNEDGGQVDGIKAIRSPGSTLKPFLYGLAIDKGLIVPKTKIADTRINYSGYEPENYNEKFNGLVTVDYALANSLNIPAVKILDQLKPYNFIQALSEAGFKQIENDRKHLGLSTVLGGCGVRLEELGRLYAAFANHGMDGTLKYRQEDSVHISGNILSTDANYMISEILTGVTRPDLPTHWQHSTNLPKVAWKTGTSYGRRDAWSIGFNKKYTIGVWVGNFSGEGVQGLTGSEMAAPLLFELFNATDQNSGKSWFNMPKGVHLRHVCNESGQVPNEFCTTTSIDYYIPGISDFQKCDHMKYVMVSADSSISYCTNCLPTDGYVKSLYPNHSPEMIGYFSEEKITFTEIPKHNPLCERVYVSDPPKILSPIDKFEYFVDEQDSLQIMLQCEASNNVKKVYWYINDQFYQSSEPTHTIYFSPTEGIVRVACTDDKARTTSIEILVKKINF